MTWLKMIRKSTYLYKPQLLYMTYRDRPDFMDCGRSSTLQNTNRMWVHSLETINVVLTAGQHSRHNMARPSPTPPHSDNRCCQPEQDTSIRRAPVLGPSSRAPHNEYVNNIVMLIFVICFRSAFQYISQCFPVFLSLCV